MPTNFLKSNLIITTGFLNTVNDAAPGASVASITGEQRYAGILGGTIALGPNEVRSSPAGTLFGGIYMYVGVKSGSTASPAQGTAAFWVPVDSSDPESGYIVSADAKPLTTVPTLVAGVFLNAITPGNYGFIQLCGRATVLYDSALTATIAGGVVVAKASATVASTFDCLAAATALTGNLLGAEIGISEQAAVASSLKTVLMTGRQIGLRI